MQASVWKDTQSRAEGNVYGIRVGIRNRRAHFRDGSWTWVEVELDGVFRRFRLLGGFWRECPEIRDDEDQTLRRWIGRHHALTWKPGAPPRVRLTPVRGRRFRLLP